MEISADYQSYLNSMKNYELMQGRKDFQAPNAEDFSKIYSKAQEEDLELSDVKQFLKSLSSSELQTLQNYAGLAESIDIDSLSAEGAYNLLLPDKEQYDFDKDGSIEVGIGKRGSLIPQNMPADVRDAYISAMNSLSGKDRLMTSLLTFNPVSIEARINGEKSSPSPVRMDYEYIKTKVEGILNPQNGGYSSEELKASTRTFWSAFEAAYKGEKTQETEEESNTEVEQFLKDLRTKGAAQFLADLNQEKIDKLVEEFEDKLKESMGDSPEALKEIAQLVEDYKKQLMEEMRAKTEETLQDKGKSTTTISSNSAVQMMIDMQNEKLEKPLDKLLKL